MTLLFTIELSLKLLLIIGAGSLSIAVIWKEKRQKRSRFRAGIKALPTYTKLSICATLLAMVITAWSEISSAYKAEQEEKRAHREFVANLKRLELITGSLEAVDKQNRRAAYPMASLTIRAYMSFKFPGSTRTLDFLPETSPIQKESMRNGHSLFLYDGFYAIRDSVFERANPKLMALGWQILPKIEFITSDQHEIARYDFPASSEMPGRLTGLIMSDSVVRIAFDAYCGHMGGSIGLKDLSIDNLNGSSVIFKANNGLVGSLLSAGGVHDPSKFSLFIRWPSTHQELPLNRRGAWSAVDSLSGVTVMFPDVGIVMDSLRHEQGPVFRF